MNRDGISDKPIFGFLLYDSNGPEEVIKDDERVEGTHELASHPAIQVSTHLSPHLFINPCIYRLIGFALLLFTNIIRLFN